MRHIKLTQKSLPDIYLKHSFNFFKSSVEDMFIGFRERKGEMGRATEREKHQSDKH